MILGIDFADGTLLLTDVGEAATLLDGLVVWDQRVGRHRASAYRYAAILRALHGKIAYEDRAKTYAELTLHEPAPRAMRAYQTAALAAWQTAQRRGVVVLPTGAGKSYVALRAILACQRSALVIAPTIDLVQQWVGDLSERLGTEVGQYGGGEKQFRPVTVATYDSAVLFMAWHGHRFGLLVCDECHHLPAAATSTAATACLAPFRLGLTATPERTDGGHERLTDLLGPIVHRTAISELEGNFLASYQAEIIETNLDPDEAIAYADARQEYLAFTRAVGVDFSKPDGWQQFIAAAARDSRGRAAMRAYRLQRALSRASRAKIRACWDLIRDHGGERTIIFTDDNDTAYTIGRLFCVPVLTHRTRPAERKAMLTHFRSGRWPVLATSKVLNEGVDVPEASVGIIVSGSGSVREHVQRLGRILRPQAGKTAMLYEIVSAGTGEGYTSERRRSHVAFGEAEESLC